MSLLPTSWVVASRQEDPSSRLPFADDMTGGRCRQDSILADEELLDPVCSTNFGDQLDDFGVPESPIAANDEESTWCCAFVNKVAPISCYTLGSHAHLQRLPGLKARCLQRTTRCSEAAGRL